MSSFLYIIRMVNDMNNKNRLIEIISIIKINNLVDDRSPKNLRKTIEDLGPTFIKIGQILSTRVDLIPNEYAKELSKLRGNVTPLPYSQIEKILKKEYKNLDNIFVHIYEKPIGSASIAQVHKARLKDKRTVVLKIRRPNIEEEIKQDIELLKQATKILHLNHFIKIMDLDKVLDELYTTTMMELDFSKEKENMLFFENHNKDIPYISSPKVIEELSTKNILVMEYIDGIMISNIEKLDNENYDKSLIAKELSKNYIKQALEDGMFHADPHPDNITIYNDKIYFLDWGMVGTLSNLNRALLNKCMKAIITEDYQEVANCLLSMSIKKDETDYQKLVDNIKEILEEFSTLGLDEIDTRKFITNMFKMLQENNLILDHNVTMLVRGIGVIEGVLQSLDSSISLTSVLKDKVLENEKKALLSGETLKKIEKKVLKSSKSLINIPEETESLLKYIKQGNFKFKLELSNSTKHIDKLENLLHELILGFIDGCLILAYSFTKTELAKFIMLTFIIIVSALLTFKMIRDLLHKGY